MKKIILCRNNEKFNKRLAYEIYDSNSTKIGSIRNNSKVEIFVKDDINFIKLKLNWCGSKHILLSDNKNDYTFSVKGNQFFNQYLPFSGGALPLIGIGISQNNALKYISTCIMGIIIIALISTLTIWKNRWIEFEPIP